MIITMKKATVITRRAEKQDTLRTLRALGVLHLSAIPVQVPSAQEWREKKITLEKALATIAATPGARQKNTLAGSLETALATARSILDKHDAIRSLNEEHENLKKEIARLQDWDGVSVSDLQAIRDHGYEIAFFEVPPKQLDLIPPEHDAFVVKRTRTLLWVAMVIKAGSTFSSDFKPLDPPRRGAAELQDLQAINRSALPRLRLELDKLANAAGALEHAVHAASLEIELAEATAAMGHTGELSYLAGFLPGDQVQRLKESCRDNNWALLLQDPAADDDVPTVVRNQRWIDFISPVFQLLGTVPGYREFDISLIFLLFFTFFFAAIIGDAGYGLIIFSAALFFAIRSRRQHKTTPAALSLLLILSAATILWGALTGTWFGSVKLAALPFLSWMIIPALSSFNPGSGETFKQIFFIVGTIHISIAHIWSFVRQAKDKPFIRALAQLGWLSLVLGLYYLVMNMVLLDDRLRTIVHYHFFPPGRPFLPWHRHGLGQPADHFLKQHQRLRRHYFLYPSLCRRAGGHRNCQEL
jgi:V/A-type H+-transporting ATPase subunit I